MADLIKRSTETRPLVIDFTNKLDDATNVSDNLKANQSNVVQSIEEMATVNLWQEDFSTAPDNVTVTVNDEDNVVELASIVQSLKLLAVYNDLSASNEITVENTTINHKDIVLDISGGTNEKTYKISAQVETQNGYILDGEGTVEIQD